MNEPKLTPQTIHILKRVKVQILKEPHTYRHDRVVSDCGTMMCVAGHVSALCGLPLMYATMSQAAEHLGLDMTQAVQLFNPDHSTVLTGFSVSELAVMFSGPDAHQRAEIGARYIDAFIAKYSDTQADCDTIRVRPVQAFQFKREECLANN